MLLPLACFYKVAALTVNEPIIIMRIIPAIIIGAMVRFLHARKRRRTKPINHLVPCTRAVGIVSASSAAENNILPVFCPYEKVAGARRKIPKDSATLLEDRIVAGVSNVR
jgi:hypothetical protein